MICRILKGATALVMVFLLTLSLCVPAFADAATAYTQSDGARVYDADGKTLGTLPQNTKVTVTGVKDGVCRVEKDGRIAYMKKSDLVTSPATRGAEANTADETVRTATAYAARDGAKLYDADGRSAGSLELNEKVTVTGMKDDVCRVEKNGKICYMKKSELSASPVAQSAAEQEDAGSGHTATAYVARDGAKVYNASGKVLGKLELNAEVKVVAVKGEACKVTADGNTLYMRKADLSSKKTTVSQSEAPASAPSGSSTLKAAKGTAREMDWWTSDIQMIFARGDIAQITDVETGLSWREKRTGGTNHADCQPLTAADTAAMKKAYGGKWSWNRRAVFVTIDGINYAASINGMPHGSGSIKDNDFDGHHCIHFTNSRTHGSNKVCPLHQAAIKKAASTTM